MSDPSPAATAQPAGLLHALRLDGQGGSSDLTWDEIEKWRPEDGMLWLHLDFEEPTTQRWLHEDSGLNDIAVDALITQETRPRTLNRGDNLLLSLRGINFNPGNKPEDMVSLRMWTDGRRLISTRRRSLRATESILEDLRADTGPGNASDLVVAYAQYLVHDMADTLEHFEDELLQLEEEVLETRRDGTRQGLVALRKRIIAIRRYLAPQREAMNRLAGENLSWLDELNRLRLREVSDRVVRHIEDLDEMRDRAILAQEELASLLAEEMDSRTYLFTVAAVVFLPLGFLTGLLGINVGGMPGVDSDLAFWIVCMMCLLVGVALALLLRLRRWF